MEASDFVDDPRRIDERVLVPTVDLYAVLVACNLVAALPALEPSDFRGSFVGDGLR